MYVMDHFYSRNGGTEAYLYNLIDGLDKRCFHPELCLLRYNSDYFKRHSFPCKVFCADVKSFRDPKSYVKLYRLRNYISENGFHIVQALFNDASLLVPILATGLHIKVVSTRRDMGFWYTPLKLLLLQSLRFVTDAYIVNSLTVKQNVMRKEKVVPRKIHVIYNGHSLERFAAPRSDEFHAATGIPEESTIVGCVANFRPVKRVADLIVAFSRISANLPHAYLVLVGHPGELLGEYLALIKELKIENNVRMLGMVNDAIPLVKHFDVGVICSESEGLSNSLIEYMGCDVPVVATDIPSNREVLNGVGYFYPVADTDTLASLLYQVLTDGKTGNGTTKNYRHILEKNFNIEKNHKQFEELYRQIANQG